MTIRLIMLAGTRKGETLVIENKEIVRIGRDPDCEAHFTDSNVSRIHATIRAERGELFLKDNESTNGSYINGVRVGEKKLEPQDVIALGSSVFRAEHESFDETIAAESCGSDKALAETNAPEKRRSLVPPPRSKIASPLTDSSLALPQMVDHREYQKIFECLLAIQKTLSQDHEGMIEESLRALFLVLPVTRVSLLKVLSDGELEQWHTIEKSGDAVEHVSYTFARKVLEANKAILIHDAIVLDQNEWGRTMQEQEVRSILGVPVDALGKAAAVLLCDNLDEPNILQDIHASILEFVGKVLETVFQRDAIRLLEDSQAKTERVYLAAKRVQAQIFNQRPPSEMAGLQWAHYYQPALDVGGDFYAFYQYENRVWWVIADVSGKGIPAALVVSMLKGFCKVLFPQHLGPRAFLASLSELLDDELPPYMFLTAIVLEIDDSGLLKCSNAGHNAGLLIRKSDDQAQPEIIKLQSTGNPIGFVTPAEFTERLREQKLQLCHGDKICLYTDGVTEARDSQKDFFGDDRLQSMSLSTYDKSVDERLQILTSALDEYQGGHQHDDITIVMGQF